ncbi:MAG TPA: hypothetical protein VGN44_19035 [Candidatus Angelobacter sp.]
MGRDFAFKGLSLLLRFATVDLFFFLPAMRENILSHAMFPAREQAFVGIEKVSGQI